MAAGLIVVLMVLSRAPQEFGASSAKAQTAPQNSIVADEVVAKALKIVTADGRLAAEIKTLDFPNGKATVFSLVSPGGTSHFGGRIDDTEPMIWIAGKDGETSLSNMRIDLRPTNPKNAAVRARGPIPGDAASEQEFKNAAVDEVSVSLYSQDRRGYIICANAAGEPAAGIGCLKTGSGKVFVCDPTGNQTQVLEGG